MIRIVMRPRKAPVVNGEGLYLAEANGQPLMSVRARRAEHAERKLMFLLRRETTGKVLDFRLEDHDEKAEVEEAAALRGSVPQRGHAEGKI